MKDWKNIISNIMGILIVVCGALVTASTQGLVLPTWLVTVCTAVGVIAAAVIAVLTGKNPNLTKKTDLQVEKANEGK